MSFQTNEGALVAMQESEPREKIAQAGSKILSILTSDRSDAAVGELLHGELGCYFEPQSRELISRDWLALVGRHLAGNA